MSAVEIPEILLLRMLTCSASGAWPRLTRVRKVLCERGDLHPLGSVGTVVGSIGPMATDGPPLYGYLIDWGDGVPVFVVSTKLAVLTDPARSDP